MSNEPKRISVSDWKKVEIENIKFILTEAQAYFRFLSEAKIRITTRAFSIITILIPLSCLLIAFIIKSIDNEQFTNKQFVFLGTIILINLLYILYGLGKIIMPKKSMPFGREPFKLFQEERLLGLNYDKELSMKALILNEIEDTQNKIEYNKENNQALQFQLNRSMKLIGYLFIGSTIAIIGFIAHKLILIYW